jgi:hypothetical protein
MQATNRQSGYSQVNDESKEASVSLTLAPETTRIKLVARWRQAR